MVAPRAAALFLCAVSLTACAGPMGQREAVSRANRSLRNFCSQAACGAIRIVKAQKLKNNWLVDYETQTGLYAVMVDNGGNTQVSVWDKNPSR
jgi:hypothetical protein